MVSLFSRLNNVISQTRYTIIIVFRVETLRRFLSYIYLYIYYMLSDDAALVEKRKNNNNNE